MKLISYTTNLLVYWFSFIIPKRKNVWVFGAWFGQKYADNSKYLFEYVLNNHPEIEAWWTTSDDSLYNRLSTQNIPCIKSYSLKGYWKTITASKVFVSTGMHDVNRFACNPFTRKYQLWHGTPLKKILNDDKYNLQKNKRSILPFNRHTYDFLISTSRQVSENFESAFSSVKKIEITGYPRNDAFRNQPLVNEKIITYLPTHRGEGKGNIGSLMNTFQPEHFNRILETLDIRLVIKPHFYDLKYFEKMQGASNIEIVTADIDIYELLAKTKILITDYSSVYFDFLITNRPVIFASFDLQDYLKNDREFYYDYDQVTPGPKCQDWNEVFEQIQKIASGEDHFDKQRTDIRDRFNQYSDFNSCKRVFELAART